MAEREDKVSLELTQEIIQSMEVGLAFRDYGPFDIFSVGGDMSDANVVKFSNNGRLMLSTTTGGRIHVLDSFHGTLLSTCNVKPVSSNSTVEASFSPEGMFVMSGSGDGSVYAWSVRSGKEVTSWKSTENEPPVIKWAAGNLMFATGSSELSFWIQICLNWDLMLEESRNLRSSHCKFLAQSSSKIPLNRQLVSET